MLLFGDSFTGKNGSFVREIFVGGAAATGEGKQIHRDVRLPQMVRFNQGFKLFFRNNLEGHGFY